MGEAGCHHGVANRQLLYRVPVVSSAVPPFSSLVAAAESKLLDSSSESSSRIPFSTEPCGASAAEGEPDP